MIGEAKTIVEWLTALGPWAVAALLLLGYINERKERIASQKWLHSYLEERLIPALDAIAKADRSLRFALFRRNLISPTQVLGDDVEGQ
jgi:hypothetical protein